MIPGDNGEPDLADIIESALAQSDQPIAVSSVDGGYRQAAARVLKAALDHQRQPRRQGVWSAWHRSVAP